MAACPMAGPLWFASEGLAACSSSAPLLLESDSSLRESAFHSECSGMDVLPLQHSGKSPCTTTEPLPRGHDSWSSPLASLTVSATPPQSVPPDSNQLLSNSPRRPPTSALAPEHSKSTQKNLGDDAFPGLSLKGTRAHVPQRQGQEWSQQHDSQKLNPEATQMLICGRVDE